MGKDTAKSKKRSEAFLSALKRVKGFLTLSEKVKIMYEVKQVEEAELSEWAKTRIEKLRALCTPYKVDTPCKKCGEVLYYVRKGRGHNGCIRCHDESGVNTILTPIEGGQEDGNGVKLRPRLRPKDGCKDCGDVWILDQNAYGVRAGYCRGCAVAAIPEKEKSLAINKITTVINKVMYSAMHSSVLRAGTVEVLPRNVGEWYALKALIERLTLMNQQERKMSTGVRWELGHLYPAAGADLSDTKRGVCRVENLHIIESRRNRAEGNAAPDEWLPVQVVEYDRFNAILRSWEASAALKARKAAIMGKMTPEQKEKYDNKIKAFDEQHKELTQDLLKGEQHKLESLLNTILIPSFADYLADLSVSLERSEITSHKKIEAYLQSGQTDADYVTVDDKLLLIGCFTDKNARLRAVVQTLQRIEDGHDKAATEPDYNEDDWYTLKRAAVLWGIDALKQTKINLIGFSHPLLKDVRGELWGVSVASNGDNYLCVWDEQEPEALEDDSKPFDSNEWGAWEAQRKQVKKYEAVRGKGWQNCVEVFLYEREKDRQAKQEARERREALLKAEAEAKATEERRAIVRAVESVREYMSKLHTLAEDRLNQWRIALAGGLRYYESEYTESTPKAWFEQELTGRHQRKFIVDVEAVERSLADCVDFLSQEHTEREKTERRARLICSLSTENKAELELRLTEPFGGGDWLNSYDRSRLQQREQHYQQQEAEQREAKQKADAEKVRRQEKRAFMNSPEGQAWLQRKKQETTY